MRYSPEGTEIEVDAWMPDNRRVLISVRDHGIGVPPERRAGLFDRFYQAHEQGYSGGMGLGLFISKQIVELHGGSYGVKSSQDGRGSTFWFSLKI
jgi:signal transduction histidine kinase